MHHPTSYLKMRVLGAIDMAEGHSIQARIKAVAQTTFTDEDGHARQFTWRTIQTWYTRYQKYGLTSLEVSRRADHGQIRKVKAELLMEAIRTVLPKLHGKAPKLAERRRALQAERPFSSYHTTRARQFGYKIPCQSGQTSKNPTRTIWQNLRPDKNR